MIHIWTRLKHSAKEDHRYWSAIALLHEKGIKYRTTARDHAHRTAASLAGVRGNVVRLPRFFASDPTHPDWMGVPKVNNGGLRWLRKHVEGMPERAGSGEEEAENTTSGPGDEKIVRRWQVHIPRYRGAAKDFPHGPHVLRHWHRWRRLAWRAGGNRPGWVALSAHRYFPLTPEQFRQADREKSRIEGDTFILEQVTTARREVPPAITDFWMTTFKDLAGQTKLRLKWEIPKGVDPAIDLVELERTDPEYGVTHLGLWQGSGYKIHQVGPAGRYAFRVRAYNREGAGPWSKTLEHVQGSAAHLAG